MLGKSIPKAPTRSINNNSKEARSEVERTEELRCERVLGKCEVCGVEGEINRYSRPINGYIWYSKNNLFHNP